MNFVKKLSCAIIAASMILSYTVYPAFAEKSITPDDTVIRLFDEEEGTEVQTFITKEDIDPITSDEAEFFYYLFDELAALNPYIQVYGKYNITPERFSELYQAYATSLIQNEYPDIFYEMVLGFSYNYEIDEVDGVENIVYTDFAIIPYYFMPYSYVDPDEFTDEEFQTVKERCVTEIETIRASIDAEVKNVTDAAEGMSDLEKVLYVHDYIVSNYEYDTNVFNDNDEIKKLAIRSLDNMVKYKRGVCQAYSYLFMYIMNAMDIDCITVPSDECEHMWNKVKVDGSWYNIDVTQDDSLPNMSANISHTFFLLSDDEIQLLDTTHHRGWNRTNWDNSEAVKSETGSGKYFNMRKIEGASVYTDGTFWCFDEQFNICKVIFDNSTVTLREDYTQIPKPNDKHESYKWFIPDSDRRYYTVSQHSDIPRYFMTLALCNGKIYFNSPNKIFRYDPSENSQGSVKEVYEYSGQSDISKTYFYGLCVNDGKLLAEYVKDFSTGVDSYFEITVKEDEPPAEERELPKATAVEYKEEENKVVVTVDLPEEVITELAEAEEEPKVMVAQYDENGLLIGFKELQLKGNGSEEVETDSLCTLLKAFVWGSDNTPLSLVTPVEIGAN